VDTDASYIRALMVRSIDPEKIRLRSFHTAKADATGGVQLRADLMTVSRSDRWIEQLAWRLSLEPGLTSLRWQLVPTDRGG
jgi:putative Mg2+ transporter-C (MgtC) family protein